MKNIIKQIRKIKGVTTVEKAGENMFVGIFEPKPKDSKFNMSMIFGDIEPMSEETTQSLLNVFKPKESRHGYQYVKCTTEKEYEFVKNINGIISNNRFDSKLPYTCICTDGTETPEVFQERDHRVIDFSTYLFLFGLKNKWNAFSTPKSLSPDELVDGKIYVMESTSVHIFRYKNAKMNDDNFVAHYSYKCENVTFESGQICVHQNDRILRPATPSEAQQLIRAEIEHGYFHELKDTK